MSNNAPSWINKKLKKTNANINMNDLVLPNSLKLDYKRPKQQVGGGGLEINELRQFKKNLRNEWMNLTNQNN